MAAKILIVDDHDVVRQGTRAILHKARPEWEICGEATTGREAIQAAAKYNPDVVILDISMPDMTGIEATPALAKVAPNCRILLFTMHESDALLVEAQQLGAQGYVQKSQAGRDLVAAVDRLLAGGTFFGSHGKSGAGTPGENEGPSNPGISTRASLANVRWHPLIALLPNVCKSAKACRSGKFFEHREDLTVRIGHSPSGHCADPLIRKQLPMSRSGFTVALRIWANRLGHLTFSWEAYDAHASLTGC